MTGCAAATGIGVGGGCDDAAEMFARVVGVGLVFARIVGADEIFFCGENCFIFCAMGWRIEFCADAKIAFGVVVGIRI